MKVDDTEDKLLLDALLLQVENYEALPLLRSKANASVPRQVQELELTKILENASGYLGFLNERDADGLSNKDKILSIFRYRVPYFVGPLSDRHKKEGANVWALRKEEGRFYPWNIEKKVDFEKSNEEFIKRMTNKCTYLVGEDVLPKESLLYSKYMVLNELNNLKIKGNKPSEGLKQRIFEDLFKKKTKVTGKALLNYLKKDFPELKKEDLSGFDQDFKTSLKSYIDFKDKVFGDEIEKESIREIIENIIKWITIYGNDKKMLKSVIKKEYKNQISDEKLKEILKLKYSSWGNFSKKFLKDIKGTNKETGEMFNIINGLWESNDNLMQLLSSKYSFTEEIDAMNKEHIRFDGKINYENIMKDLYVSPANKRAIWQTIQISEEVKKILGKEPKKIFIEMARGGEADKKGKNTKSRKQQLLELYKNCKVDVRDWIKEIEARDERDFRSLKLYLYHTQMGRCMYTGEEIDLDGLMMKNSNWDRATFIPNQKSKTIALTTWFW